MRSGVRMPCDAYKNVFLCVVCIDMMMWCLQVLAILSEHALDRSVGTETSV
jgi:hypothetical protein